MKKEDLMAGARKVMDCGNVKPGENVVIITDTAQPASIGAALFAAASEYQAVPVLFTMEPAVPGGELPHVINEALKEADYIVTPTSTSIFHSRGVKAAHTAPNKARGVSLSECTEDMLAAGGILADFRGIRPQVLKIGELFTEGKEIKLTTPGGTNITANIQGREAHNNTGMADEPGMMQGLPTIEVYIAPIEDSINGTIVVDASCSGGIGVIEEPIKITIEHGLAVKFEGGAQAKQLEQLFKSIGDPRAFQVAEIAMGLNPEARITGSINEDEGKYGTCHCAIGSNDGFGGVNNAPVHIDMVQWKPTITIDGVKICEDGVTLLK